MTSIQLLFKDLEFTQLIKVINSENVHDKQQSVLERYSDSNGTISDHFITISTKNSFSPLIVEETNPDQTICLDPNI